MPTAKDLRTTRVWGMVATPFVENGSAIDWASLIRLGTTLAEQGCEGLIALGVIAEPATLTLAEKVGCLETVSDAVPGLPLVATVMSTDVCQSLAEASILVSELGPRLSALMIPVISSDEAAVRRHLVRVHDTTGAAVIVQDLPSATGVSIGVEPLGDALQGLDFVAGVKCECPPTFSRIAHLVARGSYSLISGFGGLGIVDDVLSGASSVAVGVTVPEVVCAAMAKAQQERFSEAAALIGQRAALINFETQPGQSIAIRKEHWRRRGVIDHATVRSPTREWTAKLDAHSRAHGYADTFAG